jgi:hypothetical protein
LLYQDQAIELDEVVNRLTNLVKACKNRGVYDQAMDQLAKISDIVKKPDNTYMPIPNFRELAERYEAMRKRSLSISPITAPGSRASA